MKVDNPGAFRFIMHDELYLLPEDRGAKPFSPAGEPPAIPVSIIEQTEATPPATTIAAKIEVAPHPPHVLKTPEPEFNYLGNNNKQFLILVNYQNEEFMAPDHLSAMENILKRKDLALADVAIFNISKHQPITIAKIAELLKPVKLVIMGKEALPHGIGNLPFNSPVQGKKTQVLYSFGFEEMMSSNDNKKAFWDQMKTL